MHPTAIKNGTHYCPAAIDFAEAGTPYDRRVFESGIAAHAVLQACGEATNQMGGEIAFRDYQNIGCETAEALISTGRTYEGTPEPPLNADRVWAGVQIALDYLYTHPLPVGPHYEIGLACGGKTWKPINYADATQKDPAHIADYVDLIEEEDEEDLTRLLTMRDYKSAWPTDETALDTIQSKMRALLGIAHNPDAEVLSLETVNLRTHANYSRRYWLRDPETQKVFADWRAQIETTTRALLKTPRVAAPGAGCVTCPYVTKCEPAQDYLGRSGDDRKMVGMSYCIAQGLRDACRVPVVELTKDEPIELEDATVGHQYKEQRAMIEDAAGLAWDNWEMGGGEGRGFARACGLSIGNLEKLAKALMPDSSGKERADWVGGLCEMKRVKRFGITKKGGD